MYFTLDWTEKVASSRGWRYEVASEPAELELSNIRFLSGYRRDWLFDPALVEQLQATELNGLTLDEAGCSQQKRDPATARAALFRLLWRQVCKVDLSRILTPQHVIGSRRDRLVGQAPTVVTPTARNAVEGAHGFGEAPRCATSWPTRKPATRPRSPGSTHSSANGMTNSPPSTVNSTADPRRRRAR